MVQSFRPFFPVLLVAALGCQPAAIEDAPPNVVLLMADDMGWAQTGYYGHPVLRTPHLDAMAAAGLRMDRFYAGAPSCTPTRATVMTGRTNDCTGAFRVGDSINRQEKMLSTAFRQAGYATAHFGKWHLNDVHPAGDNPLPADDPHNPGELGFDYWLSHTNQFNVDPVLSENGVPKPFEGDSSDLDAIAEAGLRMDRFYAGAPSCTPTRATVMTGRTNSYGPEHPGVRPDTTGHLRGFKKDFYEGGLRVPTIIEWLGEIAPRISGFPASTMDIFPTLIEVAGLDPESINAVHDGISIAGVFDSEPARREQPIGFRASGGHAWLDNDVKLVRNYFSDPSDPFELYNVVDDPGEERDLMEEQPEIAARMRAELDGWNQSVDESVTGADYPEGRVLPSGREPK